MGKFNAIEAQGVSNLIDKDKREVVVSAGGTYNSWEIRSCKGFAQIQGFVLSSGSGTLDIYQSVDEGANFDLVDSFALTGGTTEKIVIDVYGEKVKLVFTDGGGGSTVRLGLYLIPIGSNLTIESITLGAIDLAKWGGTTQTGADLTPLFQNTSTKLTALDTKTPADPARENGNLSVIKTNTDDIKNKLDDVIDNQTNKTQFSKVTDGTDTLAINSDGSVNVKDIGTSLTPVHNNIDDIGTNTDASDTAVWATSGSDKFNVTHLVISVDTACKVEIKEGATVRYTFYFGSNGGVALALGNLPLRSSSGGADLNVRTTGLGTGHIGVASDGYITV